MNNDNTQQGDYIDWLVRDIQLTAIIKPPGLC